MERFSHRIETAARQRERRDGAVERPLSARCRKILTGAVYEPIARREKDPGFAS
jgi:hypothetical protein